MKEQRYEGKLCVLESMNSSVARQRVCVIKFWEGKLQRS